MGITKIINPVAVKEIPRILPQWEDMQVVQERYYFYQYIEEGTCNQLIIMI